MKPENEIKNGRACSVMIKKPVLFLAGCLLGAVIFSLIYGLRIVDPCYDDWIMEQNSDITQHYMGWRFYRSTPWRFPLGLIEGILSTGDISCIYTDSIPILAIFFKILSPILPETFQYIGIWELMCYALMGGTSAVLISRFSKSPLFCLTGAVPFIISPTVLARTMVHEALSGQWIIISALILWAWRDRKWKHKASPVILWTLLGIIASLTHIYFIPMIYMVMSGYIISDMLLDKKILRPILIFTVTTVVSVAVLWLFGAFYGDPPMAGGGLGGFASNYNAYFNSLGYSRFLKPLATCCENSEGLGYLGLGMLLLCIAAIGVMLVKAFRMRKEFSKDTAVRYLVNGAAAVLVIAESMFLAASPRGAFFGTVIYDIGYPSVIEKCLSVFRASGRFIWVSVYIIFILAVRAVACAKNHKFSLSVIFLCTLIQTADLSGVISSKNTEYRQNVYTHICPLETDEFDEVMNGKKEMVFVPLNEDYLSVKNLAVYYDFGEYAVKHGMKLSCFYAARCDYYALEPYASEQLEMLRSGRGREDAVYVFLEDDSIPYSNDDIMLYRVDGTTFAVMR